MVASACGAASGAFAADGLIKGMGRARPVRSFRPKSNGSMRCGPSFVPIRLPNGLLRQGRV